MKRRIFNLLALLLWLPTVVMAVCAAIMPDTFLENPNSTIPHEEAYYLRSVLIFFAVIYTVLAALGRAAYLSSLPKQPKDKGRCAKCGYDLRATPDRCPECGTTSNVPISPAPPPTLGESSST